MTAIIDAIYNLGNPVPIADGTDTGVTESSGAGPLTGFSGGGLSSFGSRTGYGGNIDADALNALISREQYQYYKDKYIPVERAAKGQIRTPGEIESLSRNAGIRSGNAYETAKGDYRRGIAGTGDMLTPDQQAEADRMMALGETASKGGAQTRTRQGLYDLNVQNRGELIGLGRNIVTGAQAGLGTAASEQARVDAANDQIKSQESASRMQTLGTIAGLALAFI